MVRGLDVMCASRKHHSQSESRHVYLYIYRCFFPARSVYLYRVVHVTSSFPEIGLPGKAFVQPSSRHVSNASQKVKQAGCVSDTGDSTACMMMRKEGGMMPSPWVLKKSRR